MGNEQSVPNRRLSKPRTTSSAGLLSQIVPKTPSRQNSQTKTASKSRLRLFSISTPSPGPDPGEPVPVEDGQEPRRRRRDLFRSRSSQIKSRTHLEDPVIPTEDIPTPVELPLRRYSVNSSSTYTQSTNDFQTSRQVENRGSEDAIDSGFRPTFHGRASLQHVPYPVHTSRLSLVAEVHSPSPEPGEFTRRSSTRRMSYNQENDAQVSIPRLSSRTNSDITNYGPIRRRSLLQPGIVTRKPVVGNDCRQSLPSQMKSSLQLDGKLQRLSYDSKSRSSPLQNYDFSSLTPPIPSSSPNQRVQTPNSLDYGHIGDFKLGSLRITNGLASPTPSDKTRPITAKDEDDYLTNGGEYKETNHPPLPSRRSNTLPPDTIISPWVTVRPASPLRQVQKTEKEPLKIKTGLPIPDPSLSLFNFKNKQSPNKSDSAEEPTEEEMVLTPFSFDASPMSSAFQVTSKNTAMEDELFEPETDDQLETAEEVRTGSSSYDSGYGSTDSPLASKSSKDNLSPKALEKADSGYSSNLSLRSFNKNQNAPMVPAKDPHMLKVSRVASNTNSVSSGSLSTLSSKHSFKSLLQGKLLSRKSFETKSNSPAPVTPERKPPVVPSKNSSRPTKSSEASRPNVPPKSESRMELHKRQQSLPIQPISKPRLKSSSSGELRNKIQKRPQTIQTVHSAPVYTVQAMPNNQLSAPPVPQDTLRHLEERVDGFPGGSFPNTFNRFSALRKSSSKETLGTIFSVGSAEVREEINYARLQGKLPAVPSPIAEIPPQRKPAPKQEPRLESNRRATIQHSSNSGPLRKSLDGRRRPSWTRSKESIVPAKSVEEQEEEFEAHVTSFDAISSSLGKSPYDVAVVASTTTSRPPSSGAGVRARSSTEMFEADTAARLQRRAFSEQNQSSATLQNRNSFGSMKTGHHVPSGPPGHVRNNSRELPPPTHGNRGSWKTNTQKPIHAPESHSEGGANLTPARDLKQRKPPVSMQTQGNIQTPPRSCSRSNGQPTPSPSQNHEPQSAIEPPTTSEDQWAAQKNFWAGRRKSAGEALTHQKSQELSRPGSTRPSMEFQREKLAQGMSIPRASSARPSDQANHQQGWGNSAAWKQILPQQVQQEPKPKYQPWTGHSTGSHRNFSPRWQQQQTPASYHHTYGSESAYPSQSDPYSQNEEYYPQPEEQFYPSHNEGYYAAQNDGAYYGNGYGYDEYYAQPDINATQHAQEVVRNMHSGRMGTDQMMALEGWEFDVPGYGKGRAPTRVRA